MPAPSLRGRFVWHELMTSSPDAAVGFYTKVVGWRIQSWEQDPSYRLWTMGGPPMGGLMRLPDEARGMGAPPHWLTYIGVPDVDATVRQAASLGARTYVAPREVPSVGRFAVLADPQGATFAVLHPFQEGGGSQPTLGDFSWHELATTDYRAAWAFYRALFGWEATESFDMGPGAGVYWMFGSRGQSVGGMFTKPSTMPAPPHWLPYAMVRSADAAAATVQRLGGRVLNGPMDVPGGDRVAQCMDPQGAAFAVHSLAAAAQRPAPTPAAKPTAKRAAKPKTKRAKAKKPAAKKRPKKAAKPKRRPKARRR